MRAGLEGLRQALVLAEEAASLDPVLSDFAEAYLLRYEAHQRELDSFRNPEPFDPDDFSDDAPPFTVASGKGER